MLTTKSRLLAAMALAVAFPLAVAPMARAYPVPPPFRAESRNQPEAALRHVTETRRMDVLGLERDIDAARADISGLKYDDARQNAEAALALANTLQASAPGATDSAQDARIADAKHHVDMATTLLDKHEPWEARTELATAGLDAKRYADQLAL